MKKSSIPESLRWWSSHRPFSIAIMMFLAIGTVSADVQVQTSIYDVWYRGTHERTGSLTFTVNDDDFAQCSPDNPYFIRITPDSGSQLADTLVDQDLPITDYRHVPIYLPMTLNGEEGNTLIAEPDTVSIVRWVKGENSFWIRIQRGVDGWISDGENTFTADATNHIQFTIGITARQYDQLLGLTADDLKNLPFATRLPETDGDLDDAVTTLLCVNLSQGDLDITGITSLLAYDGIVFDKEADIGGGFYSGQAGNFTGVDFAGDFYIARGKARIVTVTEEANSEAAERVSADNNLETVSRTLPLTLDSINDGPYLTTEMHHGSWISMSIPESVDAGFSPGSMRFTAEEGCSGVLPSAFFLSRPFTLNGEELYRYAELVWIGDPLALQNTPLEVQTSLTVEAGAPSPMIVYQVAIVPTENGYDEAPFDGVDQRAWCQAEPFIAHEGTWMMDDISRTVGHVTRADGDFTTDLILGNSSDTIEEISLIAYNESGDAITEIQRQVGPRETTRMPVGDLFASQNVSHIYANGTTAIRVGATYRAIADQAVPCQVWATSSRGKRWTMALGDRDLTYDGLAVVNLGSEPAMVTARFLGPDGSEVATQTLNIDLAANAKSLHNLSAYLDEGEITAVELVSDQALVVTALRGDYQSTFLWENPSLPID